MMTRQEMYKLAGETGADIRTVERWATGQLVRATVDYGMRVAAKRLGIEAPEPKEENHHGLDEGK